MGHIFWYGQEMSPSGLVKGMPPSDLVYALCNAPSWFGQPPCFWSKNASFWFGIIGMYPSDLIKQMPLFSLVKQMSTCFWPGNTSLWFGQEKASLRLLYSQRANGYNILYCTS